MGKSTCNAIWKCKASSEHKRAADLNGWVQNMDPSIWTPTGPLFGPHLDPLLDPHFGSPSEPLFFLPENTDS